MQISAQIYVKLVAKKIAEVRRMELADIAEITLDNAKRIYKIGDQYARSYIYISM